MLRQVLPPLITAYAIFVAMVAVALRRPVARRAAAGRSTGLVPTIAGGYVAFLAIVLIFHVWVAEEPDALASAAWGGAFLSAIAVAVALGSRAILRRR